MKRNLIVIAAVVALVATMAATGVFASSEQGHPSAKATAEVGDIQLIETTSWNDLMNQTIKTASQKDLVMDVSLECGLYTMTHVKSKGGQKDESTAEAKIEVRVLVDGNEAYPGDVVFASRVQTLTAWFQGLIEGCLTVDEEGNVIIDEECLEPEELELILDTMTANSFNFIINDLESGVHTVKVQAQITTSTSAEEGYADASALIGKGSIAIEEVRFIQDEDLVLD